MNSNERDIFFHGEPEESKTPTVESLTTQNEELQLQLNAVELPVSTRMVINRQIKTNTMTIQALLEQQEAQADPIQAWQQFELGTHTTEDLIVMMNCADRFEPYIASKLLAQLEGDHEQLAAVGAELYEQWEEIRPVVIGRFLQYQLGSEKFWWNVLYSLEPNGVRKEVETEVWQYLLDNFSDSYNMMQLLATYKGACDYILASNVPAEVKELARKEQAQSR